MHRRGFLAAAAGTLARPALGGTAKTLSCVPRNALSSIDPIWTSARIARNMGFMVFDMLYGRDENNVPRPQMIESGIAKDGAKRWTLRLRDGLRWHDGEKVLSRDCAAGCGAIRAVSHWRNGSTRLKRQTIACWCFG